ncbi:DUF4282 domain-containing protein [Marinobacter zhanjiangensis]|uniref:Membrane protein n=1 Tax=Marinobacter zhanjiangensis TaxID=578215 RepID=A0ABQ3B5A8_9GAMM|nr:DUF4282 domain-containing protein [Marinobacter zhanjiangensis]GGY78868.1 membrane protein [Marinobacter zhanjiangensis]
MLKSFLNFDSMVTPKIITVIYWLSIVAVIIGGFMSMFSGYQGFTFANFLMGLGIIVGGVLMTRIYCELFIVIFKINQNLSKIANRE